MGLAIAPSVFIALCVWAQVAGLSQCLSLLRCTNGYRGFKAKDNTGIE